MKTEEEVFKALYLDVDCVGRLTGDAVEVLNPYAESSELLLPLLRELTLYLSARPSRAAVRRAPSVAVSCPTAIIT